ncbi:MAG: hypothetical protein MK171_05340 [Pirellulales bacterium]|nr:hypothetical protein [Pirellulales bacterium]
MSSPNVPLRFRSCYDQMRPTHSPTNRFRGAARLSVPARVLIVDSSRESREILKTLLERQGAATLEAAGIRRATELAEQEQPDLIVLDEDSDTGPSDSEQPDLEFVASRSAIPIVVLGTAKRHKTRIPTVQLVSKPYHYGPLIHRIEELLGQ